MIQVGDRRLSRYRSGADFTYEYYTLSDDPFEHRNRYADGTDAAQALRAQVDQYELNCAAMAASLAGSDDAVARTPSAVRLEPADEEKLRALGYLK